MRIEFTSRGIWLAELDLWLDPTEDCKKAWISHGHRDHAGGFHREVFATPETLEIYKIRFQETLDPSQQLHPLRYGQTVELCGARLIPYPASHILGAAQLLIEWRGERIVYTGDIKLREPICGRPTRIVPCDRLITESTFGLPIFHFLSREEARERIVGFAQSCLAEGAAPVFLGHPLGRGQEIVHVLSEAGIPTAVDRSIARFLPLYASCGFPSPGWAPSGGELPEGIALVAPPGFRTPEARGRNLRLAYVSGWAALDNARARTGAEELIPYSDHADFEELLALVEQSGAREIDVVHGYAEPFARILGLRGRLARAPRPAAAAPTAGDEAEG